MTPRGASPFEIEQSPEPTPGPFRSPRFHRWPLLHKSSGGVERPRRAV